MDKQQLHILTVKMSPKVQENIRGFFQKDPAHEYNFLQADTGEKGLELCRSGQVDCILLDFALPDMDGLEFISVLSEDHKQALFPVVILAEQENEEKAMKAVKDGASDYLMKDRLTADLLIRAVRYSIERKQAEKQSLWQSRVFDGINRVFRDTLTCETSEDVARICLTVAEELTGSKFGYIGEMNPAGRFDTTVISNPGWDACKMQDSESAGWIKDMEIRGIDRSVIRDEKSRIVNSPSFHPDRVGVPEGHPPITSFLGVPLKSFDKTIGMIGLANKESGYDPKDQKAIEELSMAFVEVLNRKRAEEALNREKEYFRALVEDAPFGISIIGKKGDDKYANPKFVEMFGYILKDIPTELDWFEKAFPDEEYRSQVISKWSTAIKESKLGRFSPRTFTVTCKDESKKVIRFLPVMIETGDYFVIYQDISEREKLEAQLIQAQKMEAIGTLAGGIAHDFNNLLTTIIGNSYLMLMDLREEDPLKEGMEEIKKAGESAASLTRQLLAFSRKQILRPEVLNLNNVITGIEKMLGRLIGEDVKVETSLKPDLMQVKADPGQMEQVILNLAINARDAMPQGGTLIMETSNVYLDDTYGREHGMTHTPGPYVMLAMSDTGIGMDRETRGKIFEPFFTTKERDKGTGLGLSTVYGIVKQSEGYIWVYSEPGEGTTFKIYLPAEEQKTESMRGEPSSLEGLGGAETVLLVEDDESLRSLARKTLTHYGYNVLEAGNGEEALRLSEAHNGPIHLMVTDVVMPGMSGSELVQKTMPLFSEMKVIYMSGYTDDAIAHHGVLESGVDFIEKPFTPERFVRKIREVLGKNG